MSQNNLDDTKPEIPVLPRRASVLPELDVEVGARTHPGRVRPTNEDNFHVAQFGRYLRTVLSSLPVENTREEDSRAGYGFAVADGMGGHLAGEIASRLAITALLELALQTPDWILGREDDLLAEVMDRTTERFQQVDQAVRDKAQNQSGPRKMGTTLSLAMNYSDALIVAHVGDSRAYLFRDGALRQLTRDHTVAQELAERNPGFAARFRHVLTRCIGGCETWREPDVARYRLLDGDRLLLCTDGLTEMVDDAEIARELARPAASDEVCRALVEVALENGGQDNVTAVVATYRKPSGPAETPRA